MKAKAVVNDGLGLLILQVTRRNRGLLSMDDPDAARTSGSHGSDLTNSPRYSE